MTTITAPKAKNRRSIQFTRDQRDERTRIYVATSINTMHVYRHSGAPHLGLLVGRSVFPILVGWIHHRMVAPTGGAGTSLNAQLESLYSRDIIDEVTHLALRRAAAALGEFGSGRDLADVMAACDLLNALTKTEAFREAEARRLAQAQEAASRRPKLLRWATAACALFAFAR
ncbi:hypothetical protein [Rhodopirellula sp. MGV]|uniref:hypothetical protein n=1 Tax=Rhodopirellula sp. MGV TaxID=2023130 RepID=UPI000B979653|nr:hypothetical protein [Rhodopirellula sp. MGV]OYP38891.1 hypothetical protein CGZ80_01340 [Rhodopirellula sp. MGV]PNY38296.1 hypothetical protein C2E31_03000 [Rhodopirellula baltica]